MHDLPHESILLRRCRPYIYNKDCTVGGLVHSRHRYLRGNNCANFCSIAGLVKSVRPPMHEQNFENAPG
jgi:hypothetical protein